jgi:hypothetical protein
MTCGANDPYIFTFSAEAISCSSITAYKRAKIYAGETVCKSEYKTYNRAPFDESALQYESLASREQRGTVLEYPLGTRVHSPDGPGIFMYPSIPEYFVCSINKHWVYEIEEEDHDRYGWLLAYPQGRISIHVTKNEGIMYLASEVQLGNAVLLSKEWNRPW